MNSAWLFPWWNKVKATLFLCLPLRYTGYGGVAPLVLNLGTSWKCVVCFMPRPLYARVIAPGTRWIGGRVGLSRFGRFGEELNLFATAVLSLSRSHYAYCAVPILSKPGTSKCVTFLLPHFILPNENHVSYCEPVQIRKRKTFITIRWSFVYDLSRVASD